MKSPKIGLGCHSDTAWGFTVTQKRNSTDVFMKHNNTKRVPWVELLSNVRTNEHITMH